MSRFLGPRAFGIAAFVVLIYTALGVIVDTGVTSSVARSTSLSESTLSRLHALAVVLALTGCGLLVLSRDPIARFLVSDVQGRTDLATYEFALVIPVLSMALQAVPRGLLIRKHQFRELALADLSSMVISYSAALALASRDRGSAAPLVLQLVLMGVCRGLFVSFAAKWLPSSLGQDTAGEWREQWHFLRKSWSYSFSTFVSRNGDNYIVSQTLGVLALGFYSRAFSLFLSPFTQLQYSLANIMLRNFSFDQCPDDRSAHARYSRLFAGLGVIAFSASGLLFVGARPVVLLLFGEKWLPSVPLVRAFSLALLTQLLLSPALWFLQARGPARGLAYLGYLNLLPLVGVLLGGLIGSLNAVAIGYGAFAIGGNLLLGLAVMRRSSGLGWRRHASDVKSGFVTGLLVVAAATVIVLADVNQVLTVTGLCLVLAVAGLAQRKHIGGALSLDAEGPR